MNIFKYDQDKTNEGLGVFHRALYYNYHKYNGVLLVDVNNSSMKNCYISIPSEYLKDANVIESFDYEYKLYDPEKFNKFIESLFKPDLKKEISNLVDLYPKDFFVLHIRSGDYTIRKSFLTSNDNTFESVDDYKIFIDNVMKVYELFISTFYYLLSGENIIIYTDSIILKNKMIGNESTNKFCDSLKIKLHYFKDDPIHVNDSKDSIKTVAEYHFMKYAKSIYCINGNFTAHSMFSTSISFLNNIPYYRFDPVKKNLILQGLYSNYFLN